jgi:hypothetical protein
MDRTYPWLLHPNRQHAGSFEIGDRESHKGYG